MPSQDSNVNLNFKIKLLSGNNVVLVDCPGFESELFMPQIIKGRITFQNIIPNHRCCNAAPANVQTGQLILPACKFGDIRLFGGAGAAAVAAAIAGTPQRFNYEGNGASQSTPLARSTPSSKVRGAGKENAVQMLTPEQARFRPASLASNPASRLDALLSKLETSTAVQEMPPPLNISESGQLHSLPRPSSISTTESALCGRTRKVAPPVRTYARRKPNSANVSRTISWSPLQKKKKTTKVSSTKPPSPHLKLVVRPRKLIMDTKKTLTPSELYKVIKPVTKKAIELKQVSGKTRAQFEALKETAFDLLTTPGQSQVSDVIKQEFKKACVEKFSETLPNYAELAATAPLQLDRQVKMLMAKEKRMEKPMTRAQRAVFLKNKSKII